MRRRRRLCASASSWCATMIADLNSSNLLKVSRVSGRKNSRGGSPDLHISEGLLPQMNATFRRLFPSDRTDFFWLQTAWRGSIFAKQRHEGTSDMICSWSNGSHAKSTHAIGREGDSGCEMYPPADPLILSRPVIRLKSSISFAATRSARIRWT